MNKLLVLSQYNGVTELHEAVFKRRLLHMKELLQQKADPNIKCEFFIGTSNTALHWAAILGYTAEAKILLEAGANKEAKDAKGRNALELTRIGTHDDTKRLIEGFRPNTNKLDYLGNPSVVDLLLDGANNEANNEPETNSSDCCCDIM